MDDDDDDEDAYDDNDNDEGGKKDGEIEKDLTAAPDITIEGIEEGEMRVPILGNERRRGKRRGRGPLGGQSHGMGLRLRGDDEDNDDNEEAQSDEQVRELESMMVRMQAVKGDEPPIRSFPYLASIPPCHWDITQSLR